MAFKDHYTHLYEIVKHQLCFMQLYNTQHAHNLNDFSEGFLTFF